jgi:hypothetical protein
MLKQQWVSCSEKLPGVPWVGKIKVKSKSGRITEYDRLPFNGKDFTWQSDDRSGVVVAWLGLVEVPDPF